MLFNELLVVSGALENLKVWTFLSKWWWFWAYERRKFMLSELLTPTDRRKCSSHARILANAEIYGRSLISWEMIHSFLLFSLSTWFFVQHVFSYFRRKIWFFLPFEHLMQFCTPHVHSSATSSMQRPVEACSFGVVMHRGRKGKSWTFFFESITADSSTDCFDLLGLISAVLVPWKARHKNFCPAWMFHFFFWK